MQALVKRSHDAGDVAVVHRPRPTPAPGQVLVRTEAVGLCGSDVHAWREDPGYEWVAVPVVLGHEAVGVVEEVGAGVGASWRGRRVVPISIDGCGDCRVCRSGRRYICTERSVLGLSFAGAAAELFAVDVDRLVGVDPAGPASALVLTEPLAIAVHAARRLVPEADHGGMEIVVTGPGPIGILAAMLLQDEGHRVTLVGTERDRAVRLAMADRLGLRTSVGEDLPADPPLWLEASGAGKALGAAIGRIAMGGTIVVPALFSEIPHVDVNLITRREINVLGSYGASRCDYEVAAALIAADPQRWAQLVSSFPLQEAAPVLERISRGEVLKAALVPCTPAAVPGPPILYATEDVPSA